MRQVLNALVAMAVLVEAAHAVGWWQFRRLVAALGENPAQGASSFIDELAVASPALVEQTFELADTQLRRVGQPLVSELLRQCAAQQQRWCVSDPTGTMNRARAAVLDDDVGQAVVALTGALLRDPTSPYLHRLAASLLQQLGRQAECVDHLAEATALDPGMMHPTVVVSPEQEDEMVLESLRRRVVLYPSRRVTSLIELAGQLRRRGKLPEAEQVLTGLQDHPQVLVARLSWLLEDSRVDEIIAAAPAVAQSGVVPKSYRSQAYALLAEAYAHRGSNDQALDAAKQSVRLNPHSPAPFVALASVAEANGDLELAFEHLRKAWGLAPSDIPVLLKVARMAKQVGRIDDGALALRRATEMAPYREDLAVRLVEYHRQTGNSIEAALCVSQMLDRFPTSQRLLRLAGR